MTQFKKTEVSTVTEKDYPALARFLSSTEEPSRGEDFWKARLLFWWDENPAFSPELERGWALREDEALLGFIGRIPTLFQRSGKVVTVFNVTTWRVLPACRNQSMKLLFQFLKASGGRILFDTTPDTNVAKILERSGFTPLSLDNPRYSFTVLNPEKIFPKLLALPFRLWQQFRLRKLKGEAFKGSRLVKKADVSFDEFWARTRERYQNTNVRTSKVLHWYCFGNQNRRKELFGYYQKGQLQGYAVCWGRETKQRREFECVDLWVDFMEDKIIKSLVRAILDYAKENSFDLVVFPHFDSHLAGAFKRCGLFQRKILRGDRYVKMDAGSEGFLDPRHSYFVSLQGDYGL